MRTVALGEVCKVVSGSTPKRNKPEYWGGNIPWVTPKELSGLDSPYLEDSLEKITELGYRSCSTTMLPPQSVLLSSRAPIGLLAIARKSFCTNQGFKSLVPSEEVFAEYLYYCLKFNVRSLQAKGNGATFKELSKSVVEDFKIPLPPLDDQKRIAHLLGKVEGLITQRKQHLQQLDDLLKSVFLEMFGDPVRNEKAWDKKQLSEIATVRIGPFGSLLHAEDYITGGIPLINPSHMVNGEIVIDESLTITKEKFNELSAYHLSLDDVVVARRGEIGRCALVRKKTKLLCGTGSMFVRVTGEYLPIVLQFMIYRTSLKDYLENNAKGVTMKNLNSSILETMQVITPPLDLQKQFAAIVKKVEGLRSCYQQSLTDLGTLYGALSQKAFKGELDLSRVPLPKDQTLPADDGLPHELVEPPQPKEDLGSVQKTDTDQTEHFNTWTFHEFLRTRKDEVWTATDLWEELQKKNFDNPPPSFESFKKWILTCLEQGKWLEQVYGEVTADKHRNVKEKKVALRIHDDS